MPNIIEVPGPCVDCKADKICAELDSRPLCNDCWHAARYKKPPFAVRHVDSDLYVGAGTYLEHEAEAFAREMEQRTGRGVKYEHVPASGWYGDRIAHPGYMNERRAAVYAAHPEYAPK